MFANKICCSFDEYCTGKINNSLDGIAGVERDDPDLLRQSSFICKAFQVSEVVDEFPVCLPSCNFADIFVCVNFG